MHIEGSSAVSSARTLAPITMTSPRTGKHVHFANPLFLAPMEGITDAVFRDLVIALGGVGGACTEFIRISNSAMSVKVVRRYLGDQRYTVPVGVQFMAAGIDHLAESIHAAERVGAPYIDLNFGCPVPVVFNKCAGSALLNKPELLAAITRTAVGAATVPVSVKIRAGVDDPSRIREIVAAVIENGAAMLTVHARLRSQSYAHPATWLWLAHAREERDRHQRKIPLIGNGGVDTAADVVKMRDETHCDGIMIGRAALANPFIFSEVNGGEPATATQAAAFALHYADVVENLRGKKSSLAKLKQLVRYYHAGHIFENRDEQRTQLLRCNDVEIIRSWFQQWI